MDQQDRDDDRADGGGSKGSTTRPADPLGPPLHRRDLFGDPRFQPSTGSSARFAICRWYIGPDPTHQVNFIHRPCTGLGKVLLAHMSEEDQDNYLLDRELSAMTLNTITRPELLKAELPKILQNGFAVDNEELEIGVRCVAAPIRDHLGDVVAALSVSGPSTRITATSTSTLVGGVVRAASAITEQLGGHPK